MPALYTITTRASGTILTAAIYNTDHQNHVNNGDAQHLGGFSANTSQMRTQTSPGDIGTESLSLSISDELARIRYMIAQLRGSTFWYGTSSIYNSGPGSYNYIRNSDFLTWSRQGQAVKTYAASAGDPYTADQWYVHNGANQAMAVGPGNVLAGTNTMQSGYVWRTAGQTGTGQMWIGQPFSLAQFVALTGQRVCYSFYCSCGANFSAASITSFLCTGTGANAAKISGITGRVDIAPVVTASPIGTTVRISGTGVIPANASQLEFQVNWFPTGTAGANDIIIFGGVKLELGSTPTTYWPPDPYAELAELQTWYYKTFLLGVNPTTGVGQPGAWIVPAVVAGAVGNNGNSLRFPTRMLKTPTITLFNINTATAQARNIDLALDCTATTTLITDETNVGYGFTGTAGTIAGHRIGIHLTAEAGI